MISWIRVNKFFYKCQEQEELIIEKQPEKIYNLGLHEYNVYGSPNAIQNFSDHILTSNKISAEQRFKF